MGRKQPRYDLPNPAPEPLRIVQRFVNTIDISHEREWLLEWLADQELDVPTEAELARARAVREAIRALLYANNGQGRTPGAAATLNSAADAGSLSIDFDREGLVARAARLDGILGRLAVVTFAAMGDGSWQRLKCCRNHECRWAFYDTSKNRSATWCSMQICGNRTKTRRYRERSRDGGGGGD